MSHRELTNKGRKDQTTRLDPSSYYGLDAYQQQPHYPFGSSSPSQSLLLLHTHSDEADLEQQVPPLFSTFRYGENSPSSASIVSRLLDPATHRADQTVESYTYQVSPVTPRIQHFREPDRYFAALSPALIQKYTSSLRTNSDAGHYDGEILGERLLPDEGESNPFGGYPTLSFPLYLEEKEEDDYVHNPDPIADAAYEQNRFIHDLKHMDLRSFGGAFGLIFFFIACSTVFVVYPILTYSRIIEPEGSEKHIILTEYEFPLLSAIRTSMIDPDTPESALSITARDGLKWPLVFSDEFNAEGRTFYEGDDQFWTAPDIHYAATNDLEWYDPDACVTANGTLNLRMDAFKNHDLFYRLGMVQLWNKLCFTQGQLDIAAQLPNYGHISGLWPGLWTLGNLGRPGYLATTDGVWPYSYEACDAGITANQSSLDGLSYLPGQRLNSCTCKGEDHPTPGRGRGAPEIDALEGSVEPQFLKNGVVSQSLQLAPMDVWYYPDLNFIEIYNFSVTAMNGYTGGPYQQALSAYTTLNTSWYERGDGPRLFQTYGFEYLLDPETGYIRWLVGADPTMTLHSKALHPNGNISWRPISKEPMLIIMNLGISNNWAYIDWPNLVFPTTMRIDYVRIYQPKDHVMLGCDPPDYPTQSYINKHKEVYHNRNLTHFLNAYKWPKNLLTGCG